jgi:hypothetical protein
MIMQHGGGGFQEKIKTAIRDAMFQLFISKQKNKQKEKRLRTNKLK